MIVPSTYRLSEWDEYQSIKQTMDGRTRPIGKIAAELKGYQARLPVITEKQLFYRLREAMDPELRRHVGPHIHENMKWREIIRVCERFDSNLHHGHNYDEDNYEDNYDKDDYNKDNYDEHSYDEDSYDEDRNYSEDSNEEDRNYSEDGDEEDGNEEDREQEQERESREFRQGYQRRLPKLTLQDRARLKAQGRCFKCRKPGHIALKCPEYRREYRRPYNKPSINSAATILIHTSQDTFPTEITTAASAITLRKVPALPVSTKTTYAKSAKTLPQFKTNIERDHVLVETRINGHLAKTLVDQQTVGGDLISNKFCMTYNIPTIPLKEHITINHTTKGPKGTCNSYAQVTLEYVNGSGGSSYSETRIFYVCALHAWDVILGEPALSAVHATISLPEKIVSIQPAGVRRFLLTPWKFKYKDAPMRPIQSQGTIPMQSTIPMQGTIPTQSTIPMQGTIIQNTIQMQSNILQDPVPMIQQQNKPHHKINSMATILEPKWHSTIEHRPFPLQFSS
jgi:hypothetical protein